MQLSAPQFERVLASLNNTVEARRNEKRRSPRTGLVGTLVIIPINDRVPMPCIEVRMRDASIHGVGFISPMAFKPKDQFLARLAGGTDGDLVLVCEVANCRRINEKFFGVGAKFSKQVYSPKVPAQPQKSKAPPAPEQPVWPANPDKVTDEEMLRIQRAILS